MKKSFLILISMFLTIYGCSADKTIRDESLDIIDLTIEQNGTRIDIFNDTAEIRRSPFSIRIKLSPPDSIVVNASFNPETFNNAKEGLPINELAGFKNTIIEEKLFNKDKILFVSFESPGIWYYSDDSDHSFSSVLKIENGYLCTREISGIIDLDDSGDAIDISRISEKEIYIVFLKSEWNKDYTKMIEKSRKVLKLKFII